MTTDRLTWLKDNLTNNWSIAGDNAGVNTNTNNPIIDLVYNHKVARIDYNDFILLYETGEPHEALGIGGREWTEATTISVDIRTTKGRTRLQDLKKEVIRIVDNLQFNQDTMWRIMVLRKQDLTDKSIQMQRFVIDVLVEEVRVV